MTTLDNPTYDRGAVATWRLLAKSDGSRGLMGGLKQYIVRIELRKDGIFVVKKFWGKADGQELYELSRDTVAACDDYHEAYRSAYRVVRKKLDGGYWHDYARHIELVDA
jgi:hypothetical protein